ncbi:hypothetical protein T4B_5276 [Trichinella pseudospiralis]|uniref:Uncharacterized protein n=1 Tax=Trichinella pseudospiralis TaxID=6337 RepID=A0A0V1GJZ2_TRIPS|nr:hypothetical protein T4A_6121 [Trichinella pseudospiralis]KRY98533.1 hypothetical protein T4B_5276 [Trichinella pseudospiralis]
MEDLDEYEEKNGRILLTASGSPKYPHDDGIHYASL